MFCNDASEFIAKRNERETRVECSLFAMRENIVKCEKIPLPGNSIIKTVPKNPDKVSETSFLAGFTRFGTLNN